MLCVRAQIQRTICRWNGGCRNHWWIIRNWLKKGKRRTNVNGKYGTSSKCWQRERALEENQRNLLVNKSRAIKKYTQIYHSIVLPQSATSVCVCAFGDGHACGMPHIVLENALRFHLVSLRLCLRAAGEAINSISNNKNNRRKIWKEKNFVHRSSQWMRCGGGCARWHASVLMWMPSVTEMAWNMPTVNNIAATNDLILDAIVHGPNQRVTVFCVNPCVWAWTVNIISGSQRGCAVCLIHLLFNQA